jgi:hypothetical protein
LKEHVRGRGLRLSWNEYAATRIEALLSRGDRRLNPVVERAWRLGARFDGWDEWRDLAAWQQAFDEADLDLAYYLYRTVMKVSIFPGSISTAASRSASSCKNTDAANKVNS